VRVIAGSARGVPLRSPGAGLRPTTDAIRETLFNSLQALIPEARFLDLYAGTGSVGIEALSRGAAQAVFVERSAAGLKAIRLNLANTRLAERGVVVPGDIPKVLERVCRDYGPFDVVFVDPPYGEDALPAVVAGLLQRTGLAAGGVLVVQHPVEVELPAAAVPYRQKRFGHTRLSFLQAAPAAAESDGG